jgi:hypothetical protein
MANWLKDNASIVYSWAALIAVAAIVFGASRGTQFAQFGTGLLTAAIALLVLVCAFEAIWQALAARLDSADGTPASKDAPKHRQRGQ